MKLRVWLDDARPMPDEFNALARTYEEAVSMLRTGEVELISLDHDLGTEQTGYDVACWIEIASRLNRIPRLKWDIHTANQVGGDRMLVAMKKADGYWDMWERRELMGKTHE